VRDVMRTLPAGRRSRQRRALVQRGGFLLEALVALLVFAFGAVAIAGLHTRAIRQDNDAHYRARAAEIAESTLAIMHGTPAESLVAAYNTTSGRAFQQLLNQAAELPGVTSDQNTPVVEIRGGPSSSSHTASVIVSWRSPGEWVVHRYTVNGTFGNR